MQVKVSEIIGEPLSWAVAKAEGTIGKWYCTRHGKTERVTHWNPSTNWYQGGPIINGLIEEGFLIQKADFDLGVKCFRIHDGLCQFAYGPTPLIAAMRCFVASKLGDTIEIPQELQP